MSEQPLPVTPSCEPNLDQHLAAFIAALAQAGYADKTQRDKARLISPFLRWIADEGIRLHGNYGDSLLNALNTPHKAGVTAAWQGRVFQRVRLPPR
jgi:hypothetical protein